VPVGPQKLAWQGTSSPPRSLEKGQKRSWIHGVPALWEPMRCNCHRMAGATVIGHGKGGDDGGGTSTPLGQPGSRLIERERSSSKKISGRREAEEEGRLWFSTWSGGR